MFGRLRELVSPARPKEDSPGIPPDVLKLLFEDAEKARQEMDRRYRRDEWQQAVRKEEREEDIDEVILWWKSNKNAIDAMLKESDAKSCSQTAEPSEYII